MIEINLLPKGYRKKQASFSFGKTGLYAVVAAAGVVLMLVGVTVYQMNQLSSLEDGIVKARQRAAMLEKDIKLVDALTDVKAKISARMAAVERLDSHRSSWVRILEDISANVPEFVWLARFTEKAPLADTAKMAGAEAGAPAPPPPPRGAGAGDSIFRRPVARAGARDPRPGGRREVSAGDLQPAGFGRIVAGVDSVDSRPATRGVPGGGEVRPLQYLHGQAAHRELGDRSFDGFDHGSLQHAGQRSDLSLIH
ncbi:MAG: hypothetical protein QUT27_00330, partial [candidate division Zixibacteria bacterium]|nr:hypothetical protein [candidate division Zixibacteria bacterium]